MAADLLGRGEKKSKGQLRVCAAVVEGKLTTTPDSLFFAVSSFVKGKFTIKVNCNCKS